MSSAVLVTDNQELAQATAREIKRQLKGLPRKSIASSSLRDYGVIIVTGNLEQAATLANRFAPEHLEIMVNKPGPLLGLVKNAGAIFTGKYTPEVIGDYLAGPSHVLPTGGTARFSSPLDASDFLKRTSLISFSRNALEKFSGNAIRFAELEGLQAHGRSVSIRFTKKS